MKKLTTICLLLILTAGVSAQDQKQFRNISTYFTPEKKYLVLPVKNGAEKRVVQLLVDGLTVRTLDIELAEDKPDWLAFLRIDEWTGKPVELRVNKVATASKVFSPIQQTDEDVNGNEYRERLRGQFHFSPKRGWTNDPNGMVYYKGEYHLFFQHNPYGRGWGNMTWGHAVSKDLVHWEEVGDALHPNQFGTVFSGSAVVDEKNTSGLGKDGDPAMVTFHTGAGSWAQCLSWSTDGRTFQSYPKAAVIRVNKDNRDPKVIWHGPSKKWIMVFWVERGDDELHTMEFFSSTDLKSWSPLSVVKGGKGNDRYLFECPEFYEMKIEGTNETRWILTGANSEYAIGTFDGTRFVPETERLNGQVGRDFYAAQTFNNEPNGRRIEIGWWRTHTATDSMTFNQSQSIAIEQKLVRTPEGPRIARIPVKELEVLRDRQHNFRSLTLSASSKNPLEKVNAELAEIRFDIQPAGAEEIVLNVRGVPVTYNVAAQEMIVDGVKARVPLQNGKLSLIVFADRIGLEIFANGGLQFMPVNINLAPENRSLSLAVKGGRAKVDNLVVYELKSIWK